MLLALDGRCSGKGHRELGECCNGSAEVAPTQAHSYQSEYLHIQFAKYKRGCLHPASGYALMCEATVTCSRDRCPSFDK
jgi:hypothetical protein